MNILHLLSQNHLTGAEVYAATLASEQIQNQNQVYQISNGFFYTTEAKTIQLEVETKSKIQFLKNVLFLRKFISENKIHMVHAHSRAASKLAYWATVCTKTGYVSTVHGVQHSSFSKRLFNQYGQFIFAVSDHIKNQLIKDFNYSEDKILISANPIDEKRYYFSEKNSEQIKKTKIAIIGRATGPKKTRTELTLNYLFKQNIISNFEVYLVGATKESLNISDEIKNNVRELPVHELNSPIYQKFDLVIGSGRVCMESCISGIPTVAFGEACFEGLITTNNFNQALKSNFGDIHPDSKTPAINEDTFNKALSTSLSPSELKTISDLFLNIFSSKKINSFIERRYQSAYFLKNYSNWIPVLMYHKIPDTEIQSQHKIYVTKDRFEKHLKFYKSSGFTTLTFSDLEKFRTAQISFDLFPKKPLILTFDDGYVDNLVNASPLLKEYGFKAQIFLLANHDLNHNKWDVDSTEPKHEILSKSERQQWVNSAFEIGSHGFSHQKITDFKSTAEIKNELADSKASLEKEFNIKINTYAFTYGITTPEAAKIAEEVGYSYAVNTDTGGLNLEKRPFAIFRVNIFPDDDNSSLFKKTSSWYRRYYYFKRKK